MNCKIVNNFKRESYRNKAFRIKNLIYIKLLDVGSSIDHFFLQ